MNIITTSELQKKIGEISNKIAKTSFIVTNKGKGRIILLPYFDGCDEKISDYMEEYELSQNKENLVKRYVEAEKSGESSLTI